MKSKLLFCWIGTTDIKASVGELESGLGPIVQAVKEFEFTGIHLLADMDESANLAYSEWLKGFTDAEIHVHPCQLSSPMNFAEIYEASVSVLNSSSGNARKFYHISPGTSAMAGLCSLMRLGNCHFMRRLSFCV